jgi:hypothetical protein
MALGRVLRAVMPHIDAPWPRAFESRAIDSGWRIVVVTFAAESGISEFDRWESS